LASTRELFAVPPAEFVAARDALAKELRAAGRDAEAEEVAALRRPTAPVWAVNQLARRAPEELAELLESSERVRRDQLRGASGDELRAAMAAQREAMARLERAAEQILRGAGLQSSPGALRTVQSTLQAAATGSREMREQLREGTMREALEPAGFEALLGASVKPAKRAPEPSRPAKAASNATTGRGAKRAALLQAREEKRAAAEKAREERKLAREAMRLEGVMRKLDDRAQKAERAAAKAREAAEAARARLAQLKR